MLMHKRQVKSELRMCLRQIWIEQYSLARELVCSIQGNRIEMVPVQAVDVNTNVRAREQGVGSRVVSVDGDRHLKETPCCVNVLDVVGRCERSDGFGSS